MDASFDKLDKEEVVEYRKKLISTFIGIHKDRIAQIFTLNLVIAFIPAAILGFFFHSYSGKDSFHIAI